MKNNLHSLFLFRLCLKKFLCLFDKRSLVSVLLSLLFFFPGVLSAQPSVLWAKSFGGTGTDIVYDVATDAAGNVYMVGGFHNTFDADPGPGVISFTVPGN